MDVQFTLTQYFVNLGFVRNETHNIYFLFLSFACYWFPKTKSNTQSSMCLERAHTLRLRRRIVSLKFRKTFGKTFRHGASKMGKIICKTVPSKIIDLHYRLSCYFNGRPNRLLRLVLVRTNFFCFVIIFVRNYIFILVKTTH